MSLVPHIQIHQLSYNYPGQEPLFQQLSLNLDAHKIGLVGRNGVGKSTLLKCLMGELIPAEGSIHHTGTMAYCSQLGGFQQADTVAHALGIAEKLQALANIAAGSVNTQDYDSVAEDWDIEQQATALLNTFSLSYLALTQGVDCLSGGELTRLKLVKAFLHPVDFLVLDEPTNNLDMMAREQLYQQVVAWSQGMLVVSHDRGLLNHMDEIIELTSLGAYRYGGNYDFYCEQKRIHQQALQHELETTENRLKSAQQSVQNRMERYQKDVSKGVKARKAGSQAKIILDRKKGQSERTIQRLKRESQQKLSTINQQLQQTKAQLAMIEHLKLQLPDPMVPKAKQLVVLENVAFGYDLPLLQDIHLIIKGSERYAITGSNGVGKSTLVKLILGQLSPQVGRVKLGAERLCYVDQKVQQLHDRLNLIENFLELNPQANEATAYQVLAQFLFRKAAVFKQAGQLSGGERIRALLACVLMAEQPPQLMILDEPTNHLDLESLQVIERALSAYKGALLVISHDMIFLENIGIEHYVSLNRLTQDESRRA